MENIHQLSARLSTFTVTHINHIVPPTPTAVRKHNQSRYGHKLGTMAALMDDMLWNGSYFYEICSELERQFGGNRVRARDRAKIRAHIKHLARNKGVNVIRTGAYCKAEVETLPATGEAVAEPEVETTTTVETDTDFAEATAWLAYRYHHFRNGSNRIAA